jgi:hypothetical protein
MPGVTGVVMRLLELDLCWRALPARVYDFLRVIFDL